MPLLSRTERQASILRGAAQAFARNGFAGTSMDDVAAACGVTKLILYRHFETKEVLYRAVLQRVFERHGQELAARMERGEARGLGMRTLLTVAREDEAGFTLLWRQAAREPQFADYARELREAAAEATAKLLGLHMGDPALDRWAAQSTIGWLVDAVFVWLEVGDPARDDEVIERAATGLRALRDAWIQVPAHAP
ncbi:MAG TPA: helix-turn-helix domain-containing protein [Acidimicrobiales bacterium]|nr:helix-turn-helix domain-containing protein [Acidimicrobiales bacterium]